MTERREGMWVGLDQAASSATNFGASALLAGLLSGSGFGAIAVAFSVSILVVGAGRAVTSEPLLQLASASTAADMETMTSQAYRTGLIVGLFGGLGMFVAAVVTHADLRAALSGIAIGMPTLVVHDTTRVALVMQGRARRACQSDAVWLAVSVAAIMALRIADHQSVLLGAAAWSLGAIPATVWALWGSTGTLSASILEWLRRCRRFGPAFALEFAIVNSASATTLVIVTAITGTLDQSAHFRGAQVMLGPVAMGVAATSMYYKSRLVRAHNDGRALWRIATVPAGINVLLCGAALGTVLVTPDAVGARIFGATWRGAVDHAPVVSLPFLALGIGSAAFDAVRATGRLRELLVMRLASAVVVIVAVVSMAKLLADRGAITGFGIGSVIASVIPWWWLRRLDRNPFRSDR